MVAEGEAKPPGEREATDREYADARLPMPTRPTMRPLKAMRDYLFHHRRLLYEEYVDGEVQSASDSGRLRLLPDSET